MAIKLKNGIPPETLRKYGFKLGSEYFGKERWCGSGSGYQYQANWYHKFLMQDPETFEFGEGLENIAYTDEEFDIPMVQISFRIGDINDLYIDCSPSCTYHIGGSELDVVSNTIFRLVQDGVVELI